MGGFLVLPLTFFITFTNVSIDYGIILFSSTILNAIATVTALKAVKYGDLSLVWPLSAFTIPFLILTGFIIAGEVPNIYGVLWVLLIFVWSYFLQISEVKKWLLGPVKAIYKNTWAKYMLLTAIIWSITTPFDKLWVVQYGVLQWMFMLNISIALCMTLYTYVFAKKSFWELTNMKVLKKISLLTILGWCALLIQMLAIKLTLAVYVISIKRASGVFSVILGYIFFQEKSIVQKLTAACIMLAGVITITVLGNI